MYLELAQIGILGVSTLYQWYMHKDDKVEPRYETFTGPSTDEGSSIPVVFGRCRVDSPLVVMARNYRSYPVIGHEGVIKHAMNVGYVIGIPMEDYSGIRSSRIHSIYVGDKVIQKYANHGELKEVQAYDLFGGAGSGGGVNGVFYFCDGRVTQDLPFILDLYLSDPAYGIDLTTFPSYRGQMSLWTFEWVFGESSSIDPYAFEVSTFGTPQAGFAEPLVQTDADPALVIYEILTGPFGKLNIPSTQIDLPSFAAASVTLSAEGHGYSLAHYGNESARDIIQNITAQINGVCYIDSVTGLIVLKLIRNDYTFGALPIFDADNIIEIEDYAIPSWQGVLNQVRVQFSDRAANYKEGVAVAQNQANAVGQNGVSRSATIRYMGVTDPYLAGKIAQRELAVVGTPVSRIRFTCTRDGYTLRPGDAIRINMPTGYQLIDQVFRVASVDLGQLFDNKITVDAVLDVFNLGGEGQIAPPADVNYEHPIPGPLTQRLLTEAPWWMQQRAYTAGVINSPDVQRVLFAAKADEYTPGFWSEYYLEATTDDNHGGGTTDVPAANFAGAGSVQATYSRELDPYDTTIGLYVNKLDAAAATFFAASPAATATATEIRNTGKHLIIVGDELMAFETFTFISAGVYRLNNVWRGLLDTATVAHAVGESFYFVNTDRMGRRGWRRDEVVYGTDTTFYGPIDGSGGEATDSATMRERCMLPYPPADLKASNFTPNKNVVAFDEGLDLAGSIRRQGTVRISRGDDVAETNEMGVTYSLAAQKVGGVEVLLQSGATAPSWKSALLGKAGHGALKVFAKADKTIPFSVGTVTETAWRSPAIDVAAPVYRNLLANPRFADPTLAPWISTGAAAASVVTGGAEQLGANTSNSYIGSPSATLDFQVEQDVDITGYRPVNMGCTFDFYVRGSLPGKAGGNNYAVSLLALDASGASLGSVTTGSVAATSEYRHVVLSYATLPIDTKRVAAVMLGGASIAFTETSMRVGQLSSNLLANPDFESALTGWTATGGTFTNETTTPYSLSSYARGGTTNGTLKQTIAIGDNYKAGYVTLSVARMNDNTLDTGEVTLTVRNSGGTTLATIATAKEAISPLNQWVRRKLAVALPATAFDVVVTLAVDVVSGAPANTCFDDLDLRLHKDLDPVYSKEFRWDGPITQPMPSTWQSFKHQYPDMVRPFAVLDGSHPSVFGMEINWSDNVYRAGTRFIGPFSTTSCENSCHAFTRQTGAGALELRATGTYAATFANFRTAKSFCVVGIFRVDERTFGGACGITGRNNGALGWGVGINASGQLTATLYGILGTKTVTRTGSTVTEGALHMFALDYDQATNTLTLYDERGTASVSTATGMGEIYNAVTGQQFRVGRSAVSEATLPGQLARLYMFNSHLTSTEINAMWKVGKSNVTMTYAKAFIGYSDGYPGASGDTLLISATDQVAYGYSSQLASDGGTGWGLAMAKAVSNILPSIDFTNATFWNPHGGVTLTQAQLGPAGLARGVVITGTSPNGIYIQTMPLGSSPFLTLVFWAKADALQTVNVKLLNSTSVLKQTMAVTMTTGWKKHVVVFTAWDASTANCIVSFANAAGSSPFTLGDFMWASQVNANIPAVFGLPGAATAVTVSMAETPPEQFNYEGEIIAEGVCASNAAVTSTIASVKPSASSFNRRELTAETTPKFSHYDGAGTAVASTATALDWSQLWKLRGRWNNSKMLDNATNPYSGIIAVGSVNSTTYGRTTTWTANDTQSTVVNLGTGIFSTGINALIRRVQLTAREEIL